MGMCFRFCARIVAAEAAMARKPRRERKSCVAMDGNNIIFDRLLPARPNATPPNAATRLPHTDAACGRRHTKTLHADAAPRTPRDTVGRTTPHTEKTTLRH